jgi:hypothetical protein
MNPAPTHTTLVLGAGARSIPPVLRQKTNPSFSDKLLGRPSDEAAFSAASSLCLFLVQTPSSQIALGTICREVVSPQSQSQGKCSDGIDQPHGAQQYHGAIERPFHLLLPKDERNGAQHQA